MDSRLLREDPAFIGKASQSDPFKSTMVFRILYPDYPVSHCSIPAVLIAFHLSLRRGVA